MNNEAAGKNLNRKSEDELKALREWLENDYQPRTWEEINADMKTAQRVIFCKRDRL